MSVSAAAPGVANAVAKSPIMDHGGAHDDR
jgi:hypothetical protein